LFYNGTLGQLENVLFAVHDFEVPVQRPNANVAAVEPSARPHSNTHINAGKYTKDTAHAPLQGVRMPVQFSNVCV
jgi:hypothetical protein